MSEHNILSLPYNRRRIIVVADPQRLPADTEPPPRWSQFLLLVTEIAFEAVLGRELREGGDHFLPVSWADAEVLRFPIGHPRKNVVYIGHPVDPPSYIPAADFHRFLFEHKIAEAQRLIRSLGALSIEVIRIEGWDLTSGVNVGMTVPTTPSVGVNVTAGREAGSGRTVLATMKLNPTMHPRIPEGLVWFPHEPLWQEVAQARLESGLGAFVVDVRSMDDYGVNANLKTVVSKAGLEFGGSFVEHRNTVWRLQGTFAPTPTGGS
jgi:hypothetical protein